MTLQLPPELSTWAGIRNLPFQSASPAIINQWTDGTFHGFPQPNLPLGGFHTTSCRIALIPASPRMLAVRRQCRIVLVVQRRHWSKTCVLFPQIHVDMPHTIRDPFPHRGPGDAADLEQCGETRANPFLASLFLTPAAPRLTCQHTQTWLTGSKSMCRTLARFPASTLPRYLIFLAGAQKTKIKPRALHTAARRPARPPSSHHRQHHHHHHPSLPQAPRPPSCPKACSANAQALFHPSVGRSLRHLFFPCPLLAFPHHPPVNATPRIRPKIHALPSLPYPIYPFTSHCAARK
ncbi:uncharacterized protein IWZ02DRAFT_318399 [Phyllosticta citriasiana]|uniref:uncharacterized protein n=1 Tax=Phyllosticta citriasiana TaxID=595635 RepID=UPI0030FDA2CD